MKTALQSLLLVLVLLFTSRSVALAAGFSLTYIGALTTNGASYNHWWYTVASPTLKGTAVPSTAVVVTIDSTSTTVTSDASGNWTAPTTMANGDHQVSLVSEGSTISFTLTIGSTMPGNSATPSGNTAPATGSGTQTMLMALGSIIVVASGLYLLKTKISI